LTTLAGALRGALATGFTGADFFFTGSELLGACTLQS